MRVSYILSALVLIGLLFPSKVNALEYTGWVSADQVSTTGTNGYWSNPDNAITEDGSYATTTRFQSPPGILGLDFASLDIPDGAILEEFNYRWRGYRSAGGATPFQLNSILCYSDCDTLGTNILHPGTSNHNYQTIGTTLATKEGTIYRSDSASNLAANWTFPLGTLVYYSSPNTNTTNGAATWYLDMMELNIGYDCTNCAAPSPTAQVDSLEASMSAMLTYLSLSGDVATDSADFCEVEVRPSCSGYQGQSLTGLGYAIVRLESPYSTPSAQPLQEKVTGYPRKFYGYNFDLPGDSEWLADIYVDYLPASQCDIQLNTRCFAYTDICTDMGDDEDPFCYQQATTTTQSTISQDVSSLLGVNDPYSEPEPDNIFLWFFWKLKQTVIEFFTPDFQSIRLDFNQFQAVLNTKAPFAYVAQLNSFRLDAVEEGVVPAFAFPIPDQFGEVEESVEYIPEVADTLDMVRQIMTWMLVVMMVRYFVKLARRFHG